MARFHKKVTAVTALTPTRDPQLSKFELIMLFLQKLERAVANQDQRTIILGHKKDFQNCVDTSRPPSSLTAIQIELTEIEALIICKLCGATDHQTRNCPRRNGGSRRVQVNMATGPMNKQLKCFKCNGNHRLSTCSRATQEEKDRIYGEKFPKRKHLPEPTSAPSYQKPPPSSSKPNTLNGSKRQIR